MKLLVGCPVRQRAWALDHWFAGVELACAAADVVPSYVFVADPRDEATVSIIQDTCMGLGRNLYMLWTEEGDQGPERAWSDERYVHMAELRNSLLKAVRYLEPELFLSCDSDIFLNERSLVEMMALLEAPNIFGAVGSKTYLHPRRTDAPNYARLQRNGGLDRQESAEILTVDVLMAIKLMTPTAYAVDYEAHHQGEDIGWSLACARRRVKLGWTGKVVSKHAMTPEAADRIDKRCGY